MSKQIEEIMELVEQLWDMTSAREPFDSQASCFNAIETKLRDLIPGWQPIESAPKDGTEVLCWREDCGRFIAKYTSADSFPMTQAEIDAYDEETQFSKDWFTQWPQAIRLDGSETPTHWMPLPKAPE